MKWLPAPRSSHWFVWFAAYTLILSVLFWINRFILADQPFDGVIAFRFVLLALVIALIINGAGWLGGRVVWLVASLGIVAGQISQLYYSLRELEGFADLAGFLAFFLLAIFGLVAGILAEVVWYFVNRNRTK